MDGSGSGSASAGRLIGFQVLTGSGTYTPTTGTASIFVKQWSAGGAGGGANVSADSIGAGGSAGSFASKYITSLAASYAYVNGAGGAGNNGATGNAGGTSTFGAVLTVPGGAGGLYDNTNTGGEGNIALPGAKATAPTGGDVNIQGAVGSIGFNINTSNPGIRYSGQGGSSEVGAGGASRKTDGVGNAATGFAAGGGGAVSDGTSRAGGAGTAGVTMVWEYS
jgi:hypothetical protein